MDNEWPYNASLACRKKSPAHPHSEHGLSQHDLVPLRMNYFKLDRPNSSVSPVWLRASRHHTARTSGQNKMAKVFSARTSWSSHQASSSVSWFPLVATSLKSTSKLTRKPPCIHHPAPCDSTSTSLFPSAHLADNAGFDRLNTAPRPRMSTRPPPPLFTSAC